MFTTKFGTLTVGIDLDYITDTSLDYKSTNLIVFITNREMSILYIIFIIIYYFYNSCIIVTNSFKQIIDTEVTNSILGNFSDLLVDIGEDVLLECDDNHRNRHIVSYEWFRKEENWFAQELLTQRIHNNGKYLLVNENKVSTVLYKCITRTDTDLKLVKSYKLYVDRMPRSKRDITKRCLPPKCKPYATVKRAKCDVVELNITYPYSQHGFNRSTHLWGNVLCNDEIGGFQIWVVGYGILKRFLPHDIIAIEDLQPGKTYCFNGWAYNSCGAGPVFTLEGVCARNEDECITTSTEHCEYDFNYHS